MTDEPNTNNDDKQDEKPLTMADIKRMTEAEINRRWLEVSKVLETGS